MSGAPKPILALVFAALLAACSAPQLAYNNAHLLLRFQLYGYLDPDEAQDAMLIAALDRLHAWHRRHELPGYVQALQDIAGRVESGLQEADIAHARELADARYRRLAERAIEEARPILRTLKDSNFAALERKFAERNEEYVDEFLDGDEAERRKAAVERLREHIERWVKLRKDQAALLDALVARHPRLAELRLANRKQLQARALTALQAYAQGDEAALEALRAIVVDWERHSTPEYRAALQAWEADLRRTLVQIDRSLSPAQRREAVANLRRYGSEIHALVPADVRAAGTGAR